MRKAPFSGISVLEPNDNPLIDGAAFFEKDPAIIDHFLEVGAVTHRHDGHDPLPNPTLPASASIDETAGAIGPDIGIAIGYTLTDPDGGETLLSPIVTVTTPPPLDPPETPPTAAVEYTAGSLLADTYYYGVTLLDGAGGETPFSVYTTATREPGPASGQIRLTDLTADFALTGAVAWRLYRSRGGEEFNLLATGSGDEFLDDGTIPLNCDITPPPSDSNTTNGTNTLLVQMPSSAALLALSPDAVSFTIYGTVSGSWSSPAVLSGPNPVVASGGLEFEFQTLQFLDGSPPDVSTSVPGATPIDAETELQRFYWKMPVAASADLPASEHVGEVRLVLGEETPYAALGPGLGSAGGGGWTPIAGGGGGGHVVMEDGTPLTQRADLNFGAGLTASDDGTRTNVVAEVTQAELDAVAAAAAAVDAALDVRLDTIEGDYATNTALTAHLTDTTDAHDASAISSAPAGNLVATDVQAALAELDAEKVAASMIAASGAGIVFHGSTANTAKPTGYAQVIWVGSVEPDNWIDGDIWIDTT